MTLLYVGKGAFLRGVPRRDLSDVEAVKHGGVEFLVGTGLYALQANGALVNQYFAGAKIKVTQEDIDKLFSDKREQQAPAAPIEKPKRKSKRADPSGSVKEG